MMQETMSIHVFIICWVGKETFAHHIADSLIDHVDHLTVIYSNENEQIENGSGNWHKVPNEWFFGKKFHACLEKNNADILLQIAADAHSDDWPELIANCMAAFNEYSQLGIWTPNINHTPWSQDRTAICPIDKDHLWSVIQTDAIVWALSTPVIQRLKKLDYQNNNLGWGIDWAAIAIAYGSSLLVLRDTNVEVLHPQGSGYASLDASNQMEGFLSQLSLHEQTLVKLLQEFYKSKDKDKRLNERLSIRKVTKIRSKDLIKKFSHPVQ